METGWNQSNHQSISLHLSSSQTLQLKGKVNPWQAANPLQGHSQRGGQLFILAPTINLESPVNLASMSLDCWGKLDYLERTHELKVIGDSCLTSSYTWITSCSSSSSSPFSWLTPTFCMSMSFCPKALATSEFCRAINGTKKKLIRLTGNRSTTWAS